MAMSMPPKIGQYVSELPYVLADSVPSGAMVFFDPKSGYASLRDISGGRCASVKMITAGSAGETVLYDKKNNGFTVAKYREEWIIKPPEESQMPPEAPEVEAPEAPELPAAYQPPPPVPMPCFEFDGCRWGSGCESLIPLIPMVYLAKKARDGDADAIAILDGFKLKLTDADGKQYWPICLPQESEQSS